MPEPSDTELHLETHPAEFGASPDSIIMEVGSELHAEAVLAPPVGARKKRLGPAFWVSVSWIGLVILLAFLAPVLPIHPPNKVFVGPPNTPPGRQFLLGTDELGRDMLSRIIYGARVSMVVGFTSIGIGLLVGGTLGIIAGYYRGRLGNFIMGCMNVLLAFPTLILGLALITFLGQSLRNVVLAIGLISIAPISRIIRASTLTFSEREFVSASRSLGAKNFRIVTREILPNVALPTLSFGLVAVAIAIVAEGALSFLGLSVKPPTASWGGMINEGRALMNLHPYLSLVPAAVMFLTVLAFNFAGDSLRSFFDVRESAL